jgi:hypothetical protein
MNEKNIIDLKHMQLLCIINKVQTLLKILYYATIEFMSTCDNLSFAIMFYHFYN